jgi:flagellar biosynthesis GTPase FlhF
VIAVGRTILFSEPCTRIPVASMTPQPLPHRHIGMSVAETTIDIQNIKTAVKRGGLDNLYLANNGRHAITSKVNLTDFLDARPGGVVRMLDDSNPGDHIMPLVHPMAFEQIIGSLEYFDQERQNRTGVMRGAAGLEANAMNRAAVGTTMAMQSHSAMRTEHIARMLAPAVEYLFSIVHELVSKHRNKPMTLKLRGKWTTVDPRAWATKRDVRISVGVGAGNKEAMMQQLQGVLGAQVQVGLPLALVTRDNIQATNVEIMKLAGFSNPEKFWPDPAQLPPQQPQPSPEQIKAQADMQKEQFKAQNDAQKFQADQALERERMQYQAKLDEQREEMQARQKTLEQQLNAQLKQIELDSKERLEQQKLEFQRWQTEFQGALQIALADKSAQATLDQTEAAKKPDTSTQDTVAELKEALRMMQEEAEAPAELVRDANGRATHVRKGSKERSIVRGPDGRAIGIQ